MSEIREYLNRTLKLMPSNRLYEFIAAHGEVYPVGQRSFAVTRGERKQCYCNATHLAIRDPMMTYVEGMVSLSGLPVAHAWCIDPDGVVVEPTFPPQQDHHALEVREYFGVTFRTAYVERAILVNDCYGVLDGFYQRRTMPMLVELGLEAGQQWLLDHKVRHRRKRGTPALELVATVALALLLAPHARAQPPSTFYDTQGRVAGHQVWSGDGSSTVYGPDGRVEARFAPVTRGTVVYGPDGRVRERIATPGRMP